MFCFYSRMSFLFLLPEFRVNLQQGGRTESSQCANHDPDEESLVAHHFLQPACGHARNHHAESHEGGADGSWRWLLNYQVLCRMR